MKTTRWIHIGGLVAVILFGGACSNRQQQQVEDRLAENDITTNTLHGDVQTLEQRVQSMEGRLTALSSDVENLEVKTRKGAKTQYIIAPSVRATPYMPLEATARPVTPATPAASTAPATHVPAVATAPSAQGSVPPATIPTGVALSLPPSAAPSPAQTVQATQAAQPAQATQPARTAPLPGSQNAQAAVQSSTPVSPVASAATAPVPAQPAASLALPPEAPTAVFGQPAAATAATTATAAPAVAAPAAAVSQSPATAAAPVSPAPLAPKVKGEEAAYNVALALARGGQTAEAIKRFTSFLQDYPTGRYAPNAYYWMGECLYAQRNYTDALLQFKDVAARYPRHHKTADALLKAGMTYDRLGDKENAALQYKALVADFPKSEAARRVKGRVAR